MVFDSAVADDMASAVRKPMMARLKAFQCLIVRRQILPARFVGSICAHTVLSLLQIRSTMCHRESSDDVSMAQFSAAL